MPKVKPEKRKKIKESEDTTQSPQWHEIRAEKNRLRALALRKSKLVTHPNARDNESEVNGQTGRVIKVQGQRVIDSAGGFLIEDDEFDRTLSNIVEIPAPIVIGLPICEECKKPFRDSYLLQNFDYSVCDACRDPEEKHTLITRTTAKEMYLLKDCDIDKREPPLKYINRTNPLNSTFHPMKLYLQLLIEKRAWEVWRSEEAVIEQKEKRDIRRKTSKIKRNNKELKVLRMNVRSSMFDKTKKASHVHEFGEDTYNEEDDIYTHVCTECGFVATYEKM